jgi:serine/threonine-protein kinase
MASPQPPIEELALRQGLITPDQLAECQRLREKFAADGLEMDLEEILVKKGYLTKQQTTTIRGGPPGNRITIEGYEILGKLGVGGMGAVYKARQTSMDRIVAIKVLLPKYAKEKDGVDRFLRETKSLAKLNHANIVSGIDAGYSNGVYYYVMEFIDGPPLNQRLAREKKLPWKEAISVVRQIASALDHAHRNDLIHRDIKPANILFTKDGTAKLADLGMARIGSKSELEITQAGQIMGTPLYMSPEQARGESLDIRSDLYSLGITYYEMLAGKPPYTGDSPVVVLNRHLNESVRFAFPDVPPPALAIGTRLTERNRARRYLEPAHVIRDVEAAEQGRPLPVAKPARTTKITKHLSQTSKTEKSPAPLYLGLGGAAIAAVALGAIFLSGNSGPVREPTPSSPPPPVTANGGVHTPPDETRPLTEADRTALIAFKAAREYERLNPNDLEEIASQYASLVPKTASTLYGDRIKKRAQETQELLALTVEKRKARILEEARPGTGASLEAFDRHANDFRSEEWRAWIARERRSLAQALAREEEPKREVPAPKPDPTLAEVPPKKEEEPKEAPPAPAPALRIEEFLDQADRLALERRYEKIESSAPKSQDPTLASYLLAYREASEVLQAARGSLLGRRGQVVTFETRGSGKVSGPVEAENGTTLLIGGKTFDTSDLTASSAAGLYRTARGSAVKPAAIAVFALLEGQLPLAEDLIRKNKLELLPHFDLRLKRAQTEREAENLLRAAEKAKKDDQQARFSELVEKYPDTKAAQAARKKLEGFAREIVFYASDLVAGNFGEGYHFTNDSACAGGKLVEVPEGQYFPPPGET